jgi:hypothetical protein
MRVGCYFLWRFYPLAFGVLELFFEENKNFEIGVFGLHVAMKDKNKKSK